MRDWLTESDEWLSPQAAVLSPSATVAIAEAIAGEREPYKRTVAAGKAAVKILRDGPLELGRKEVQWLDRIEQELEGMPASESALFDEMMVAHGGEFDPASYGY